MLLSNLAIGAAALFISGSLAGKIGCETCYTKTVTGTGKYNCPLEPVCTGIVPLKRCIIEQTTIVPNRVCPTTVTVPPCKTTCQTGCAVTTKTIVDKSDKCVPTAPPSSCFTATTTPSIHCPKIPASQINCPKEPVCPDPKYVTVTLPPKNPWCPTTSTVTATPTCASACPTGCPAGPTITVTARN